MELNVNGEVSLTKKDIQQLIVVNEIDKAINRFKRNRFYDYSVKNVFYDDLGKPVKQKVFDWRYEMDLIYSEFVSKRGYDGEVVKTALRLIDAQRKRKERVYKRIDEMMHNSGCKYVYFITQTFNDTTLNKTSEETRRKYITREMKYLGEFYIANIDYGNENEREHYHAVLCSNNEYNKDFKMPDEFKDLGFISFKKINVSDLDNERVSKYITKLSRHAIKMSTRFDTNKIIYSKNVLPF